jgi:acyl-homoserine-lactone acylase
MPLRRAVRRFASAAVLLAALLCVFTNVQAQPAYKPAKGSEILWDKWGVPHIFAKNTRDMFFLYGYAQAQAHGDLLLHVMAGSRGRSSEIYGAGEGDRNLKTDRWVWLNEIPKRSQVWLDAQTPEFRGYMEAFAAGINAYGKAHPEKLSAEARQVLPVSALDVIEHTQHFVNFEFVSNSRAMDARTTTEAALQEPESPFAPTNLDMQDGSNGWAIAPAHTVNGASMMLMNPHLAMAGETTYFEAQLVAPGINLTGASQVGLPVMRFCFSDYVAITNTVNTGTGALSFKIKEQDGGYLYDGKVLKYETAQYPIRVKQKDGSFTTEIVQVQKTVHGPIVRREGGVPIALMTAGLDRPFFLEQYWKMDTAHNFAEYEAQLKRQQVPTYNIMYADRDGHIEYLFNSLAPRRTGDWAMWTRPVDGSTSATMPHLRRAAQADRPRQRLRPELQRTAVGRSVAHHDRPLKVPGLHLILLPALPLRPRPAHAQRGREDQLRHAPRQKVLHPRRDG